MSLLYKVGKALRFFFLSLGIGVVCLPNSSLPNDLIERVAVGKGSSTQANEQQFLTPCCVGLIALHEMNAA